MKNLDQKYTEWLHGISGFGERSKKGRECNKFSRISIADPKFRQTSYCIKRISTYSHYRVKTLVNLIIYAILVPLGITYVNK